MGQGWALPGSCQDTVHRLPKAVAGSRRGRQASHRTNAHPARTGPPAPEAGPPRSRVFSGAGRRKSSAPALRGSPAARTPGGLQGPAGTGPEDNGATEDLRTGARGALPGSQGGAGLRSRRHAHGTARRAHGLARAPESAGRLLRAPRSSRAPWCPTDARQAKRAGSESGTQRHRVDTCRLRQPGDRGGLGGPSGADPALTARTQKRPGRGSTGRAVLHSRELRLERFLLFPDVAVRAQPCPSEVTPVLCPAARAGKLSITAGRHPPWGWRHTGAPGDPETASRWGQGQEPHMGKPRDPLRPRHLVPSTGGGVLPGEEPAGPTHTRLETPQEAPTPREGGAQWDLPPQEVLALEPTLPEVGRARSRPLKKVGGLDQASGVGWGPEPAHSLPAPSRSLRTERGGRAGARTWEPAGPRGPTETEGGEGGGGPRAARPALILLN